jgi:hypothetical protein
VQFADHFTFCNFVTEPRYTPLCVHFLSGSCAPFELYWTRDFIVCSYIDDIKALLQQWINEEERDCEAYAWLLNQLQQQEHTDFRFADHSPNITININQVSEKIAVALLLRGKVGVYHFGVAYLKQLRYYARGRTTKDYTEGSVYFETEDHVQIAHGSLWLHFLWDKNEGLIEKM